MRALLLAAALALAGCTADAATPRAVAVIAKKGGAATRVTLEDVSRLYSGGRPLSPQAREVRLADYSEDVPIRDAFYLSTTKRDGRQMHAYWVQVVFSGAGRPPVWVANAAEMISAVERDERMLGYVWDGEVAGDVQIVFSVKLQ